MVKTFLFNLNELSLPRKEFEGKIDSHYREFIETLYKIIIFAKYDENNLNHWIQELYAFTGGLFIGRPRLTHNNKFADREAFERIMINKPFLANDKKTYNPDDARVLIDKLLISKKYSTKNSDFRNSDFLDENVDKVMDLTIKFLRECCVYLGKEWPLSKEKYEIMVPKYFGEYITKSKEEK